MRRSLSLLLLVFGCATAAPSTSSPPAAPARSATDTGVSSPASSPAATAVIEPRSDSNITGSARFTDVQGGLGAHVEVQGATPGQHGVHVHEKGDCSDPKAASAGGHYNPNAGPHHGGAATPVRHGGDLGNLEVDPSGRGTLEVVVQGLSVNKVADGVVGRAIVIHEKVDDLQTDPAGNSGGRFGCGVIVASPAN
jgi:superoxide dismutase, Cu-Zn family